MTLRRRCGLVACAAGAIAIAGVGVHAAAPAGEFRFAIIGDRTGAAQPGVYEQVWREVDTWKPGMAINVGDSIEGGKDATAAAEWRGLKPLLARYARVPFYFTPGNHDIWSKASRTIYERETRRPAQYSFDFGAAHFTVLDNSEREDLGEGQLEYLERDLAKNQARPVKLVFFHRPFWLIPVMLGGDFPLHRLMVKYGVRYVVSGHAHRFARFEHGGVTYLMVGSSGGHLRSTGYEEGWFFHYVRATVAADGKVQMTIKEVDPPLGQGRSFTEQEWGSGPVMRGRSLPGTK